MSGKRRGGARRVLFEGRHMVFLERGGWEYVEHRTAPEAAMIVALTTGGEIVLVEEFRPPMNAPVVSLPAGLVGDEGPEEAAEAARRELLEETGHEAAVFTLLARGPGSAGQSSEMVSFFLARDARRVGEQAARDAGKIEVHVVPVAAVAAWARGQEARGAVIDPKIWAGLYLAGLSPLSQREALKNIGGTEATSPRGRSSGRPSRARPGRPRSSRP